MEIAVLGPLSIRNNGVSVVPSAGKPRQILALLALRAGRVVPVATLMEEAWGDDIPRSAATTLQTYILQLRKKITSVLGADSGESAKDVLATSLGGYQLRASRDRSDLAEFGRLANRGAADLEAGNDQQASDQLRRALALWRGPALVDVPVGRILSMEVLGMDEARMQVLEHRIEADLRLGMHTVLLGELRMLVAQHPMHENLCAQLMLALYRSGSPWRALEVFRQLRATLREELGVEPSPRLQRLHRAVLANDPALDLPGQSLLRQLAS
ncbi:AfsR/SARP family transcriptional regulator [Kitasatospora herbaricolor]|uniref:AfsR/SARP family transcriptional regulator n=1 Tax=Kitasatospora herbaricolor TaxID=68217 RepID=A0ABZ1WDD3_9ACTN|nr:AfsR/SARP family transcriptional regulator [Kitasatospora herbaricolor]